MQKRCRQDRKVKINDETPTLEIPTLKSDNYREDP